MGTLKALSSFSYPFAMYKKRNCKLQFAVSHEKTDAKGL